MEIYRDGVEIDILPEIAKCCADDAERNPLNINMCPIGEQYCSGDCDYYTENQNFVEDGKGVQTWQKECCYWIIYLQDVVIVH